MKTSFFFIFRIAAAWTFAYLVFLFVWSGVFNGNVPEGLFFLLFLVTLGFVVASAVSHIRRIRLIAGNNIDPGTLANRQRRQIEIPLEAGVAFDLVDAAIRELPRSEEIESARDSLQVRAKVTRINPYSNKTPGRFNPLYWTHIKRNQILATVTPGDGISSLTLVCEPESGAWSDWFKVDDGTNLENAEAITRAITRRVAERRRGEQAAAQQTATEKELTVAKLSLLHAQVEPHFLYNTLASAQYLTRSDPARADADARQPDHLPAPFAAAHRGFPVHPGRRTGTRARLSRNPEDPHGRAAAICRSRCPRRSSRCRSRR